MKTCISAQNINQKNSYLSIIVRVNFLRGVAATVVLKADGGGDDGVSEHQHEDHDVEPGHLEDTLTEGRGQPARLVFIYGHHFPAAFWVTLQHLKRHQR